MQERHDLHVCQGGAKDVVLGKCDEALVYGKRKGEAYTVGVEVESV